MYCTNCSNEIDEKAAICPKCGIATPLYLEDEKSNDSGSIGWGVLGFFLPLVGLILFLVWKKEKPKSAKMSLIGAAISLMAIVVIIISILTIILIFELLIAFLVHYMP